MNIQQRMTAKGFLLEQTGGGCTAYVRTDGEIEELVTYDDHPSAPEQLTDRVAIGTREEGKDGDAEFGYTLTQVLRALEDPNDEYILLTLRLYNGLGWPK